jgi:molecular chaperone GrpE
MSKAADKKTEEEAAEQPVADLESEAADASEAANDVSASESTDSSGDAEAGSPDTRVAELEAQVADLDDKLLRALAETENIRRRSQRERAEAVKFAAAGLAKDLFGVADNLRRALESIPPDARTADDILETLISGVELTERELMTAFERHGIRKIEPLDEKFDHNFHQAMFEVENSGKPAGTVVQLLQIGYALHDRLLRPAMVGVAKGEDGDTPDSPGLDTKV